MRLNAFECVIHSPGCSKEPKEVPPPVPSGSRALCVPSLCPPCFPFQGALRPGQGLPVCRTLGNTVRLVYRGNVCTAMFSPAFFTCLQHLLGDLTVSLGIALCQ